jgi:hypothetical protein
MIQRDLQPGASFRHIVPRLSGRARIERQVMNMGWSARLGLGILVLLVLGAGGLAWYGGTLQPPHRTYHQVLSNDRFK